MKPLFAVALILGMVGCAAPASPLTPPQPTAAAVLTSDSLATALAASGLPVVNLQAWTAETDPNKLLGRPSQYVSKISWTDSRVVAPGYVLQADGKWRVKADDIGRDEMPGGTIEAFADTAALESRFKYTDAISKSGPLFAQYIFRNDQRLLLVRLAHELTPAQAEEYKTWLGTL